MKIIALLGPVFLAGAVRQPAEGPITVSDEDAERLIDAGQAEEVDTSSAGEGDEDGEDLNGLTVEKLKDLAAQEGAPIEGLTKKADLVTAIEKHRAG